MGEGRVIIISMEVLGVEGRRTSTFVCIIESVCSRNACCVLSIVRHTCKTVALHWILCWLTTLNKGSSFSHSFRPSRASSNQSACVRRERSILLCTLCVERECDDRKKNGLIDLLVQDREQVLLRHRACFIVKLIKLLHNGRPKLVAAVPCPAINDVRVRMASDF